MRIIKNAGTGNYRIRLKVENGSVTIYKNNHHQLFTNLDQRKFRSLNKIRELKNPVQNILPIS
jgi:hypothetical protein